MPAATVSGIGACRAAAMRAIAVMQRSKADASTADARFSFRMPNISVFARCTTFSSTPGASRCSCSGKHLQIHSER